MCGWITLGAIAANVFASYLAWQAKRANEDLTQQYQHYVETLERVVAQYQGH